MYIYHCDKCGKQSPVGQYRPSNWLQVDVRVMSGPSIPLFLCDECVKLYPLIKKIALSYKESHDLGIQLLDIIKEIVDEALENR